MHCKRYGFGIVLLSGWMVGGLGAAAQLPAAAISQAGVQVGPQAVYQPVSQAASQAGVQSGPQAGLAGEFVSLASRAALIFVGQVVSIERRGGAVEITFNVEQAILGAPGSQYTLREWAGLWPAGQFRYSVGQRALLFLHGPSAAGFGSPVDGADGVVPVIVGGLNAPELLDVRRLSAALLRPVGTPLPTETQGAIQLAQALPLIGEGIGQGLGKPGTLRPDPVRVPMPVHVGLSNALVAVPVAGPVSAPVSAPVAAPVSAPVSVPGTTGEAQPLLVPAASRVAVVTGGAHVSR